MVGPFLTSGGKHSDNVTTSGYPGSKEKGREERGETREEIPFGKSFLQSGHTAHHLPIIPSGYESINEPVH